MVLVWAFCPYTVKEHKQNENIQFEAMDPVQFQMKAEALLLQDPSSGWLAESRETGSEVHSGHPCPVGHLPLTAAGAGRTCWPNPLQGLCWELFPFLGKQIYLLWGKLSVDGFSLRRIYSDLCLSVVASCLRLWKSRPSTILWAASLRSLIALSFTRVDPRGLHLPDQGQR